jgi:hypothetical protein
MIAELAWPFVALCALGLAAWIHHRNCVAAEREALSEGAEKRIKEEIQALDGRMQRSEKDNGFGELAVSAIQKEQADIKARVSKIEMMGLRRAV